MYLAFGTPFFCTEGFLVPSLFYIIVEANWCCHHGFTATGSICSLSLSFSFFASYFIICSTICLKSAVTFLILYIQLERGVKPMQSYYNSMTYLKQVSLTQGSISSNMICHPSIISKPISRVDAKELAAKKHSEAERRRRLRINDQYANLRKILPNLVKVSDRYTFI